MTYTLTRFEESPQGTVGALWDDFGNFQSYIGELPERGNMRRISRIPAGSYRVVAHDSPRFKRCWLLMDVPGRSNILIHRGNFFGDTAQGWKTHSQGCLIVGSKYGILGRQRAVLASAVAFAHLKAVLPEAFTLEIE